MPVIGIPLDELHRFLGETMPAEELENELHRFGCSVEGWANLVRYRCASCGAINEAHEHEPPPAACDACGADMREGEADEVGRIRVLRMELLAVRPDLFDTSGLARALRGFFGKQTGAPHYALREGEIEIEVDPALAGPDVERPRIVGASVHGLSFDDASLRALMKLQENIHWALGRDRKLASIGVYDMAGLETSKPFRYRAVSRDGVRFVPLGVDPASGGAEQTPDEILAEHPKGKAFAKLLARFTKVPLLEDGAGRVLSMPPIINSEETKVTTATRDVFVDVTGLADRHVERALNIVVTSLLEICPDAEARTVTVSYGDGPRTTPDLEPQLVELDPDEASRLIGVPWSRAEVVELLRRMRHDVEDGNGALRVRVPAWRADILHPRDLIEDVAIAHGYDRLPAVELARATYGAAHPREELMTRAREALVGQGFLEVMTLALNSEEASFDDTGLARRDDHVELEHPISVEQTMVRVSTIPGLMETLAINLTRPYPQRICETGLVTRLAPESETGALEHPMAGLALAGDGFGYADVRASVDAFVREFGIAADAVAFEPSDEALFLGGRGATMRIGGRAVGKLGEVHPAVLEKYRIIHPVALAEIDLEALTA
jgi:phenylalanyl-tRNA synthetase beta chain